MRKRNIEKKKILVNIIIQSINRLSILNVNLLLSILAAILKKKDSAVKRLIPQSSKTLKISSRFFRSENSSQLILIRFFTSGLALSRALRNCGNL